MLCLMKHDAIRINCARGELVNEADPYKGLKEKRIWAAGVDVFDKEPPDPNNPLFTLPNTMTALGSAGVALKTLWRDALTHHAAAERRNAACEQSRPHDQADHGESAKNISADDDEKHQVVQHEYAVSESYHAA
jgi:phosphoglycerate dehydrogenase-like enzyme